MASSGFVFVDRLPTMDDLTPAFDAAGDRGTGGRDGASGGIGLLGVFYVRSVIEDLERNGEDKISQR